MKSATKENIMDGIALGLFIALIATVSGIVYTLCAAQIFQEEIMVHIYYLGRYKHSEQDYDRASAWVAQEVASSGAAFGDFEIMDKSDWNNA